MNAVRARQIGNSVPPLLARAVAGQITKALGVHPDKPVEAISLGAPELLNFDNSKAAAHFEIQAPPSRRDKKSGAKKRKQIDIEQERLAGGT